jgi:signal transduction histidine kinase
MLLATRAIAIWWVREDPNATPLCHSNPQHSRYSPEHLHQLQHDCHQVSRGKPSRFTTTIRPLASRHRHLTPTVRPITEPADLGILYHYPLPSAGAMPHYAALWCEKRLSSNQTHYLEQLLSLLCHYAHVNQTLTHQQQRLDTLQQTLQRGKHQLRSPLALIRLYAENLKLGLADETLQSQADVIRITATELSDNLKKLLDLHGPQSLHLTATNLQQVFVDLETMLRPRLTEQRVQLAIATQPLWIWVDPWKLKQVLEIVVTNALEFSPAGGTVHCRGWVAGDWVQIAIADQGPGIAPTVLPHIFEPFYSQRAGGTGLGLAIAADIIHEHHGTICVENRPPGGAEFQITLPHAADAGALGVLGEFCL